MTTLYVFVDESGRKYVQWRFVDEAEDTVGDGMQELPQGKPFMGIAWKDLTQGRMIEVEDENEVVDEEVE